MYAIFDTAHLGQLESSHAVSTTWLLLDLKSMHIIVRLFQLPIVCLVSHNATWSQVPALRAALPGRLARWLRLTAGVGI